MTQTFYYRSWTDETLTADPGVGSEIVVPNPMFRVPGQPPTLSVTPLRQVINIAETTGGGVLAKVISDMLGTVKENPHKPMLFEINIG